jgi:hypothetical protein
MTCCNSYTAWNEQSHNEVEWVKNEMITTYFQVIFLYLEHYYKAVPAETIWTRQWLWELANVRTKVSDKISKVYKFILKSTITLQGKTEGEIDRNLPNSSCFYQLQKEYYGRQKSHNLKCILILKFNARTWTLTNRNKGKVQSIGSEIKWLNCLLK